MNIAIDGPAGAGKSTVAKMVAEELSYIYIDTGAMYRAITYKALQNNVDVNDDLKLGELLSETDIELINKGGLQRILLDGIDVSEEIRADNVTNRVSYVAKHQGIRKEMVKRQQQLAEKGGTVMDGRDIGTHVLPDAGLKVFLTASVEERARRRHEEHLSKGQPSDFERLKIEIAQRDKIDSEREIAPLQKAEDAVEVNSTSMTIEEVVQTILLLVKERRENVT